jgi:cytochrome c oxidase assembly factor CtaG
MDWVALSALASWRLDWGILVPLLVTAVLYNRGWRILHREQPHRYPPFRWWCFFGGLAVLVIAILSPLDAFAALLLQVHMVQHLLLLMVAPPLLWLGQPILPLVRAVPARFVRTAFGPFLHSPGLRKFAAFFLHPVVAWLLFNGMVIGWHLPRFYDLGLRDRSWHEFEHVCFLTTALLFWWPVIEVWPSRRHWPRALMIPYLLLADFVNTGLSAFLAFSGGVLFSTYQTGPRLWGISPADDQVTAGVIMWVPGSIAYLLPAVVIAMQLLTPERDRQLVSGKRLGTYLLAHARGSVLDLAVSPRAAKPVSPRWDLLRVPFVGTLLRQRYTRRIIQFVMLMVAATVVWDGFFGPQVSSLNLAGVTPWIHWRGLLMIGLLAAGNVFCMACPFMLPRELGKRLFPAKRRWPHFLRSKWLAATLLLAYLIAYEAFSLWDRPSWTAWIIVGYFVAAFTVDAFFKEASFCKYVCPIGQFNFVQSLVSPLEVKVREAAVCKSCKTYDCIRGNEKQRGCELYLFQPKKRGNLDCTFCLDCVYACPHDNVGILPVLPAATLLADPQRSSVGRLSKRFDLAMLALVVTFGGFANAAGMTEPVMTWMRDWQMRLGMASRLPVVVAYYALLFGCVAIWIGVGRLFSRASVGKDRGTAWKRLVSSFSFALVPLGFAMWLAHVLFHLLTEKIPLSALQRFLQDHGQSFGTALIRVMPSPTPDGLLSLQMTVLGVGLLLSLYVCWRTAVRIANRSLPVWRIGMPWMALALALYAFGIWVLFEPMQMRGADAGQFANTALDRAGGIR